MAIGSKSGVDSKVLDKLEQYLNFTLRAIPHTPILDCVRESREVSLLLTFWVFVMLNLFQHLKILKQVQDDTAVLVIHSFYNYIWWYN
ncbi:MAG: hypothetical protein PHW50_01340, partial [Patescibacteria group bacterium]|nr:hypothetical protein [Patescibacteria group bacterium]